MIHILTMGHLDRAAVGRRQPIVLRPLDMGIVNRLLQELGGRDEQGRPTLDDVPVEKVQPFEQAFHKFMESNHPEIESRLMDEKIFTPEIEGMLKGAIGEFKNTVPY